MDGDGGVARRRPGCAAARRAGGASTTGARRRVKPVVQLVDGGEPVEEVAASVGVVAAGIDGARRPARRPATSTTARSCPRDRRRSTSDACTSTGQCGPSRPGAAATASRAPISSGVMPASYGRGQTGEGARSEAGQPAVAEQVDEVLVVLAGLVAVPVGEVDQVRRRSRPRPCRPRPRSPPRWRSRPGRGWTRRRRPSASGPPPGPGRRPRRPAPRAR